MPSERAGFLANAQRILVDGAPVVLPLGGIVLLILGLLSRIRHTADPLAGHVPHPAARGALGPLLIGVMVGAFVPGSPAPMSGAVYLFTPDKATLLDVPRLRFLRMIASWGIGLREMVEGAETRRLEATR